jgi:hypothetical protein
MRAYLDNGFWMPELATAPRTDAYAAFVAIPASTNACLDPSDNKIKMTCPATTAVPYPTQVAMPVGS